MGLRKSKYRGLAKIALQYYATAAAINITRLGASRTRVPREKMRESAFQKLRIAMVKQNEFARSIHHYT